MTRAQGWTEFYKLQKAARQMIKAGDGEAPEFWDLHTRMEAARVIASDPRNFRELEATNHLNVKTK